MRVLNVIQLLDPNLGGGTVERTLQMSRHLARQGVDCTVLTTDLGLTPERLGELEGVKVVSFPCLNRRFFLPRFSWRRIRELVRAADVIHLMNHWTLLNALVYIEARRQDKPYVICPAGALPVVGRSRLLKKIYNLLIGGAIVRNADRMIAVSDNEVPEYLRYGGRAERVAVIPNGIDRDDFVPADRTGFLARHGLPDRPMVLFMGRLNWIKGPDLLVRAFLALDHGFSQWQLVMVGPDEGLEGELRVLAESAGAGDRIHFPGFLRGAEKSCAYHAADLLAIPSRQEAMSIVALEAGICGTPVLLTDQCGFPQVEAVGGGIEVAATAEALQAGLERMLSLPEEQRRQMGERLRGLVVGEYLWNAVVRRFIAIYEGLRESGEDCRKQLKPPMSATRPETAGTHRTWRDLLGRMASPSAIAWNMFSATALLIILGFLGKEALAAEVGVVQAATLAIFMTFSANARNLILGNAPGLAHKHLFTFRLVLLPALCVLAYLLGRLVVAVPVWLALCMVLRRAAEWMAELQISEREKADDQAFAFRFVLIQVLALLVLVPAAFSFRPDLFQVVFAAWAVSPLLQSWPYFRRMFKLRCRDSFDLRGMFPHIGSSWVIASSTYVFRIMLVLLAGKAKAGALFSAYATGGMLCSLYTYAFGPSLALIADKAGRLRVNRLTYWTVAALGVTGAAMAVLAREGFSGGTLAQLTAAATGLSLIGGGIMLVAQKKRINMLQIEGRSVFVHDILANILLIATVPFAFYLLRDRGLAALFLWSALLNAAFYYLAADSFRRPLMAFVQKIVGLVKLPTDWQGVQAAVMFLLFFPLFFQLTGRIFHAPEMIFDSQNRLALLPLPLAVPVCFSALALLLRDEAAGRSVFILFMTFILMLFSTFMVADDLDRHLVGKIILLCQVILPWFALPLGRSYLEPLKPALGLEGVFLLVLVLVIPLEVVATLRQGQGLLVPDLYLFSIYQHLQYQPVIFTGIFFLAAFFFAAHRRARVVLLVLAPFLGIYASASASTLAMLMVGGGCGALLVFRPRDLRFAFALALLAITPMVVYVWLFRTHPLFAHKFQYILGPAGALTGGGGLDGSMVNAVERIHYWRLYLAGILESPIAFFFGHEQRMPRELAPSAHNYYLDMIYNFGLVSLFPLFYLIIHTIRKVLRRFWTGALSLPLAAHVTLLLFFVLVDNSLKVGLRQPYPGLITFFLWGVLLARLEVVHEEKV